MPNVLASIEQASAAIEKATALRETAIAAAFATLQKRKPFLAQTLIENHGDCREAARWMCLHQRAFDGRTAYEVLAEGDEDRIWDAMGRLVGNDPRLVALAGYQ